MPNHHATALAEKASGSISARKSRPRAIPETTIPEELLQFYLPIVKSIVARIRINLPPHIEADDLYSVGLAGLISVLKKYDPAKRRSFGSYAAMRVRGAILDELRRMDWMPRTARTNAKRLHKAVEELEQKLGRVASEEEIRAELGLSHREYEALLDEVRPIGFIPLDQPANSEEPGGARIAELVADDSVVRVTDKLEREELAERVAARINQLPEVPRKVIAMYYYENMRLAEIAAVFGLTESRICQIHAQAIVSLRTYLAKTMNN
jgi:RNA polymerase sigma factor for flagellar operon FliA